jgi:hypothetical protein
MMNNLINWITASPVRPLIIELGLVLTTDLHFKLGYALYAISGYEHGSILGSIATILIVVTPMIISTISVWIGILVLAAIVLFKKRNRDDIDKLEYRLRNLSIIALLPAAWFMGFPSLLWFFIFIPITTIISICYIFIKSSNITKWFLIKVIILILLLVLVYMDYIVAWTY